MARGYESSSRSVDELDAPDIASDEALSALRAKLTGDDRVSPTHEALAYLSFQIDELERQTSLLFSKISPACRPEMPEPSDPEEKRAGKDPMVSELVHRLGRVAERIWRTNQNINGVTERVEL